MNFLIFATLILILFCTDVSSFKRTSQEECSVCRCHNVTADCSNRNLSKVPVLRSNITRIFLSRNNFTTVTRNLFVNVKTLNITTIQLDYCNIKHVSTDTFADFQWLTHLNISGNKELSVQELSAALVKTQLTELNLDDAGIEYMFVVVSPLRSIKTLSLKTNFIEKFNTSVLLNGFPSLRSLDLTNNRLETFPFTANLSQIEILNLTDNRIESGRLMFCLNGSDPSNKLKILNLSWNYLSNISVFKSEGHCLSHLERLILSNNYHIFKVPNNVFSRLPKIRNIRLKYVSERTDIEPLAFNVSTLIELHLTTNEQLNLQPKHINMFKLTPNLQTLHFTNVIFKNIADNLTDMFSHLVHYERF
ncbi:osteomodulin-like [Pecten maximus]|uniref:osteomodulin-like n=1 Tax=Pecten maximus TaxID=6579 RepID=UPI001457FEB8|nr:osteomodulin-like [Pecten maximus]